MGQTQKQARRTQVPLGLVARPDGDEVKAVVRNSKLASFAGCCALPWETKNKYTLTVHLFLRDREGKGSLGDVLEDCSLLSEGQGKDDTDKAH